MKLENMEILGHLYSLSTVSLCRRVRILSETLKILISIVKELLGSGGTVNI